MKNKNNGLLVFSENHDKEEPIIRKKWKILIADDEKNVHHITKMVLQDYVFEKRELEFLSAYNGEETKKLLEKHPDIAVLLLDVVMEKDDTGLEIVKFIREQLKNKFIRIVLRTGQPGQAPEKQVIMEYDINDYKEKTELTAQKLFTTITAALRSYRDLRIIDKNKMGLEKIVTASSNIFKLNSLKQFANGILLQLTSLLGFDVNSLYFQSSGFAITQYNGDYLILAGTGKYEQYVNKKLNKSIPENVRKLILKAYKEKKDIFSEDTYIGYFRTENNSENLLYLEGKKEFSELDKELIKIFSSNVSIAFDNIYLHREIEETQKEVIYTLGEVAESRSKEVGNHVKRVSELAYLLAKKLGLNEKKANLLRLSAPMHDIGKIAISDSILMKKSSLDKREFNIMKKHTSIGYKILNKSNRRILKTAAKIALEHHERWDGKGYPEGLKGENIDLFARITQIIDVFDALYYKRSYKQNWNLDKIISYMKVNKGKAFDPKIVDIFLNNIDDFLEVSNNLKDNQKSNKKE